MAAAACVPFLALGVAVLGVSGGSGASGSFRLIQFKAPSPPDPKLQPLLEDAKTIGILSATNIESVKRLDIEKVMGRLTDATASVDPPNNVDAKAHTFFCIALTTAGR